MVTSKPKSDREKIRGLNDIPQEESVPFSETSSRVSRNRRSIFKDNASEGMSFTINS